MTLSTWLRFVTAVTIGLIAVSTVLVSLMTLREVGADRLTEKVIILFVATITAYFGFRATKAVLSEHGWVRWVMSGLFIATAFATLYIQARYNAPFIHFLGGVLVYLVLPVWVASATIKAAFSLPGQIGLWSGRTISAVWAGLILLLVVYSPVILAIAVAGAKDEIASSWNRLF